jgi:hypothetical protein
MATSTSTYMCDKNRGPEVLGESDKSPNPTGHRLFKNHSVGPIAQENPDTFAWRLSDSPLTLRRFVPAAPHSDFEEFFGMQPPPGSVAQSYAVICSKGGECPSSPCGYGPAVVEANCPRDWGHEADLQEILDLLTHKKRIQA